MAQPLHTLSGPREGAFRCTPREVIRVNREKEEQCDETGDVTFFRSAFHLVFYPGYERICPSYITALTYTEAFGGADNWLIEEITE